MSGRRIRFNFLDVLIVLAVFALIAGVIWREELTERMESKNIENTVTVVCDINAYYFYDEATKEPFEFNEGQTPVYIDDTEVGYVVYTSTEVFVPNESGDDESGGGIFFTEKETKLYLKAVSKSSGYYVGGETKLIIGNEYSFNTKTAEFTVRILSVYEVNG